ncbi:hypothetical protein [Deinococcus soli (ex Cha et al. 2016)]|uniref:hypothetical protein n=1 Tax=Deinococcus soli (ex Cha et al. 2016) TaxID=1309411 RepID=UPI001662CF47|nr:hypothetical protein [Deinococcus soli (ex Cha et al. 2016)]GGB60502.1 hypothetical protein GCM10008019_15540 [Deinococcus soli (ex Cha et al. 2016)]
MKHTTKTALRQALKVLSPSTLRMFAIEIGLVEHRRGRATNDVTATQLADHAHAHPVRARQLAAALRAASKDPRFTSALDALDGVRGAGPLTLSTWTLTPEGLHRLRVQHGQKPPLWVEYSTDARVGMITLTAPDALVAAPVLPSTFPETVSKELTTLILPPVKR